MKINDYFKTTFNLFFRDKSNIFNFLLIVISSLCLLGVFIFGENVKSYIDQMINRDFGFRTLVVSPIIEKDDLGFSDFKKVDNIESVYSDKYSSLTITSEYSGDKYDGYITLVYGGYNPNYVVDGQNEFKEKYEIICPTEFYPDSNSYDLFKIKRANIINGKSLLGKEITINYFGPNLNNDESGLLSEYKDYEDKLKVVGLYDNRKVMNNSNDCYTSYETMKEIADKKFVSEEDVYSSWNVVVDKIDNISKVNEELEKLGFSGISIQKYLDTDTILKINKTLDLLKYIIIFILIIFLIFILKKKINKDRNILGIFRNLGYKSSTINLLYLGASILNILTSFIVSIIISLILFIILKNTIFYSFSYVGFECLYNFKYVLYVFGIIFGVSFFCTIIYLFIFLRKSLISIIR